MVERIEIFPNRAEQEASVKAIIDALLKETNSNLFHASSIAQSRYLYSTRQGSADRLLWESVVNELKKELQVILLS